MKQRFVVLGGCGAIGRVAVRDLFSSARSANILIADYNIEAARAYARSFKSPRVSAAFADASNPAALARVVRGWPVVINCTQHDFNLNVMEACLRARSHYLDLGGLFIWTRRQLKFRKDFDKAGLVAVLGAGCSPGITNLLAWQAAMRLAYVDEVRVRVGTRDLNPKAAGFCFPYSAQTIVEELTLDPCVFEKGRFRMIRPRTRWERVRFGGSVGPVWTVCTRHSELATLPLTLAWKGITSCDFKVGFDRGFVREVVKRLKAGETVADFRKLPAPRGEPRDVESARVEVAGRDVSGRARRIVMECIARARRSWGASAGDIDTGCPPSIVAQMIASGVIAAPGVWAPEEIIPPGPFFTELRKRGMRVTERHA